MLSHRAFSFAGVLMPRIDLEEVECWFVKELQKLLLYNKWENFRKVIQKAKEACANAGELVENHFPDIRKMVEIGSKTESLLVTKPQ